MWMMTHPYIRIPVQVRACASTRTDPNMRTGMSITNNGNLRILVPTYTCPMGDFSYHVAHILTTGSEYAERLGTQRLPARDALMGMYYQLFPKLIYGAAAFTHSPQKLEDAFKTYGASSYPPFVSIGKSQRRIECFCSGFKVWPF
jgi:hypothetical protein